MSRVDVSKEPDDCAHTGNKKDGYLSVVVKPTRQHYRDKVEKGKADFGTGHVVQIAYDEREKVDG
jgi:hypothetical protein